MFIVCFDLEGIFTPEIWICVAEACGIEELKLTTRDEPDYDKLMERRLLILENNNIILKDIQNIVANLELLPGAKIFMDWIRSVAQVAVVTDNYKEFLRPFMKKLGYPMCFCHHLKTDKTGLIKSYHLRTEDMKRKAVKSFKSLNYNIIAVGDSYNDIKMLKEAEHGILFKPPKNVVEDFPEFPVVNDYTELKNLLANHMDLANNNST